MRVTAPFPTTQVASVRPRDPSSRWLIEGLWSHQAVGIIGGLPKAGKSWLGLDIAVSVASGTACLTHFEVSRKGPVLVYLAEDHEADVRDRIEQLCAHRRLALDSLPLHLLGVPCLRLDVEDHAERLEATVAALQPRLLLLDPLVRMHRGDENSSSDISRLLGFLRELNRRHDLSIVLVHHMSKKSRASLGQALRGSGDLHAWVDSACYLLPKANEQLQLTIEHRAAPAPTPKLLRLIKDHPAHLELIGEQAEATPLVDALRHVLLEAPEPITRTALRQRLRINNARLGEALQKLEARGLACRTLAGWTASNGHDSHQMCLPGSTI